MITFRQWLEGINPSFHYDPENVLDDDHLDYYKRMHGIAGDSDDIITGSSVKLSPPPTPASGLQSTIIFKRTPISNSNQSTVSNKRNIMMQKRDKMWNDKSNPNLK